MPSPKLTLCRWKLQVNRSQRWKWWIQLNNTRSRPLDVQDYQPLNWVGHGRYWHRVFWRKKDKGWLSRVRRYSFSPIYVVQSGIFPPQSWFWSLAFVKTARLICCRIYPVDRELLHHIANGHHLNSRRRIPSFFSPQYNIQLKWQVHSIDFFVACRPFILRDQYLIAFWTIKWPRRVATKGAFGLRGRKGGNFFQVRSEPSFFFRQDCFVVYFGHFLWRVLSP